MGAINGISPRNVVSPAEQLSLEELLETNSIERIGIVLYSMAVGYPALTENTRFQDKY